jgi:hypothetical protein
VIVPIVVLALLIGGGLIASRYWPDAKTTASPGSTPSVMASEQTAAPETASPSASRTPSAKPSAGKADTQAQQAIQGCRAKVDAAEQVMKEAKIGVGHWAEHVQAQTDNFAGKISLDKMHAIFKRTRLDGPDDVKRYADAMKSYDKLSGSCGAVAGASAKLTSQLASCADRLRAQKPVLSAAANAMDDWKSHLAAMRRSAMGHVHDAQGVWIATWKAAPPHIKAYNKARKGFDAPAC